MKQIKKKEQKMKKGIPRKEKHELKTRKGGSCKEIKEGFPQKNGDFDWGQSCDQEGISENSTTFTKGSL